MSKLATAVLTMIMCGTLRAGSDNFWRANAAARNTTEKPEKQLGGCAA